MPTEADTCRTYVVPALYAAGWNDDQIREQVSFTPGRIIVSGGTVRRGKRKRVDYLLSYLRDRPLAVVEAKSEYRLPSDGLQQAKEYAELLDVRFAYSTNGPGIVEHDYTTGLDNEGWNRTGEFRKPRILYLADRNVLVKGESRPALPARRPQRACAGSGGGACSHLRGSVTDRRGVGRLARKARFALELCARHDVGQARDLRQNPIDRRLAGAVGQSWQQSLPLSPGRAEEARGG